MINSDEVTHIALIARLGIDQSEIEKFQNQLSNILSNFSVLQQLDTTDLLPTSQVIALNNVFREDQNRPSCDPDEILFNAPKKDDKYFKVQAVLE